MINHYLRKWGDPILRQSCHPVEDFSMLAELINSMHSTLRYYSGIGLAAPQVGDNRQVIIAKINGDS